MRVRILVCFLISTIYLAATDHQASNLFSVAALAQDAPPLPNSVFLFGGQFTTVNITKSLLPFAATHENNYIAGGAYERDLFAKWGFVLGAEFGVADRFGIGSSVEAWTGLNIRYTGIVFFDCASSAAVTVGILTLQMRGQV